MIEVRAPTPEEFPKIVEICDSRIGKGYLKNNQFHDQYIVVLVDSKVAGFISYDFVTNEEIGEDDRPDCDAYIDSIAIDTKYTGLGLGTILVATVTSIILLHETRGILVHAWKPIGRDEANLHKALINNGFQKHETLIEAYLGSPYTWNCVKCSPDECRCDSVVYRRTVNTP